MPVLASMSRGDGSLSRIREFSGFDKVILSETVQLSEHVEANEHESIILY